MTLPTLGYHESRQNVTHLSEVTARVKMEAVKRMLSPQIKPDVLQQRKWFTVVTCLKTQVRFVNRLCVQCLMATERLCHRAWLPWI